jgi:hypothetical protein
MRPLALALLVTVSLSGQSLSDADVARAITLGQQNKFDDLISDCTASAGFGSNLAGNMAGGIQYTGAIGVIVTTKPGLIAYRANDAKRLYKPFGLADVPGDMRTQSVVVMAFPVKPASNGSSFRVAPMIEAVVLKSKVSDVVLHPVDTKTEPVEWGNLLGGKVTSNRATAEFAFDAFREMPAGDFDVALITVAGERRCKVGAGDRKKVIGR